MLMLTLMSGPRLEFMLDKELCHIDQDQVRRKHLDNTSKMFDEIPETK